MQFHFADFRLIVIQKAWYYDRNRTNRRHRQREKHSIFLHEYLGDGELNRPWVADKVFHDKTILKQYEKIVQDQVWAEAQQFLAEEREKNTAAVVLDVPLLIECGWHTKMDSVWLVKVPKSVQIQRAMLRDGATEEAVTARINAQMSLADKEKFADVVIDNTLTTVEPWTVQKPR